MSRERVYLSFLLVIVVPFFFIGNVKAESVDVNSETDIEIIYPNGGETLEKGKTYNITWKQKNIFKIYINIR